MVSIITPTKNRKELLRETIASVRAQTFQDWEHIIVDDGSDDGSAEMVAALAGEDARIRWLARRSEKSGANVCRNEGLGESRGEFVIFLDSDDLLTPECLEQRARLMTRNHDLDFAVFDGVTFWQRPENKGKSFNQDVIGDDLLRFLFMECPWQTSGPIWRREALQKLGGFDEALPSWQDVDLHVRAICRGMKYLRLSEIDHSIRWSDAQDRLSVRQRRSSDHLNASAAILTKLEQAVRNGPGMDWSRQRALCSLYFFVAQRWLEMGEAGEASRIWKRARHARLANWWLYVTGAVLLRLSGEDIPCDRLINKWKGWMRLRTNPELVG